MTKFPKPKVQYLALRNEISEMIEKGYDIRSIHSLLTSENKISMTYNTLYKYVKNINYKDRSKSPVEIKYSVFNDVDVNQKPKREENKTLSSALEHVENTNEFETKQPKGRIIGSEKQPFGKAEKQEENEHI